MSTPLISIIIPVYNARRHLAETIDRIRKQTFNEFEAIFVDDGSTDDSVSVLQKAALEDSRVVVMHQPHSGAGTARNLGFAAAKGSYVLFSDSDDLYEPDMLERLYRTAVFAQADIVACNYIGLDAGGREFKQVGIHTEWIPRGAAVFSYRDCPNNIMRVTSPVVWNKLYRSDFLRAHNLKFDALMTRNDISFVAVSQAVAERIAYVTDYLVRYRFPRLFNPKELRDVYAAVTSAVSQTQTLPHRDFIWKSIATFVAERYLSALKHYISDFSDPEAGWFYQKVHETFQDETFTELTAQYLRHSEQLREIKTVQKHDYETMKQMVGRRIIVSLTSYPRRIGTVAQTLETIYAQTRKADEIVLWLAQDQFPGREADLPDDLRKLIAENRLTVRWCEDLKGHKKYFYALQEYTEDLVVTIDDDLLYPRDMLAALHKSYLLYPNAVSSMRTHLMLLSEDKQILPYKAWLRETDGCMHQPCMQLMTSGGAGDLYPPNLYRREFFDRDAILQHCLWADNFWVKVMEVFSDVPVVLAYKVEPLRCVGDTQEETLYQVNGTQDQYTIQMNAIIEWTNEKFGMNSLRKKLTETDIGVNLCSIEAISRHINAERDANREKAKQFVKLETRLREAENKCMQAEKNLKQAEDNLKQTEENLKQAQKCAAQADDHLRQLEEKLRCAEDMREQTEAKLNRTEDLLRSAREEKPVSSQLRELGLSLQDMKTRSPSPVSWGFKYLVYLLAWIPGKMLSGMMYYLRNGAKQTIKRIFHK